MAEGGWGSGTWGEAGWGMSVYYRDAAEAATTSDTEAVAGSTFLSGIVEVGEIVDDIATTPTLFAGVEEEVFTSSSMQVTGTQNVFLSEIVTVSDANSAQQVFATAVDESSAGVDAVGAQQVFATEVSETATGSDSLEASFAYFSNVDETATASDLISAQHVLTANLSELATGGDAAATSHTLMTSVSEGAVASVQTAVAASIFYAYLVVGATAADLLVARFFWEPIDDTQDPNWQNIDNSQASNWQAIQT